MNFKIWRLFSFLWETTSTPNKLATPVQTLDCPSYSGMVQENLKVKGLIFTHMPNFVPSGEEWPLAWDRPSAILYSTSFILLFLKKLSSSFFTADRKGQICGTGKETQKKKLFCVDVLPSELRRILESCNLLWRHLLYIAIVMVISFIVEVKR